MEYLPGAYRQAWLPYITAICEGDGTFEKIDSEIYKGTLTKINGVPTLRVVVPKQKGANWNGRALPLCLFNLWCYDKTSLGDSGLYAEMCSNKYEMEEYIFDRWLKPHWYSSKKAVYRYNGSRDLDVVGDGYRYGLAIGDLIPAREEVQSLEFSPYFPRIR